jgi:adenylate cyclase
MQPRTWLEAASQSAFMQKLRGGLTALAEAGTSGYAPDVRRRLKILNVFAYLVAIASIAYGIQQAFLDPITFKVPILINLALAATMLLVPFAHRISEIAGGMLIVTSEYVGLTALTAFFGRDAGPHLHLFIAAAAAFLIFGLKRLWLIIAVVAGAIALHLYAWAYFPDGDILLRAEHQDKIEANYIQTVITTFALIAACVYYAFNLVESAKSETDTLLRNILPDSIAERLKRRPGEAISDSVDNASVLFADISGFVALARKLGVNETVSLLNRIVSEFDAAAQRHGVEKIKTIGDAYMAAAGLPEPVDDHAFRLANFAFDMLEIVARARTKDGLEINLRIGMASGPLMAGVIGTNKFTYDVWGDTVNLASRLEALSEPGQILICPACKNELGTAFDLNSRGTISIKGVGDLDTWFLVPRRVSPSSEASTSA